MICGPQEAKEEIGLPISDEGRGRADTPRSQREVVNLHRNPIRVEKIGENGFSSQVSTGRLKPRPIGTSRIGLPIPRSPRTNMAARPEVATGIITPA